MTTTITIEMGFDTIEINLVSFKVIFERIQKSKNLKNGKLEIE